LTDAPGRFWLIPTTYTTSYTECSSIKKTFTTKFLLQNSHCKKGAFTMINFIVWIILGGVLGWIASMIMRTDAQQGTLMNVIIGIVGAFVAGLVLTPFFGGSTINQNNFSMASMLVSLLGAVILLGVVNMFRRGSAR
jgi:uncharacterized membrane protein YeaQ/YmgE (transglycosylase-associated protein family)